MATITKTISGSGGDYASPAAAATAFVAGTVSGASSGDDIVFNITQNAAFDSRFRITGNAGSYNSWTLTVDASVRHNGTYGSGARIAISTTVDSAVEDSVAALNGTVEWLEITVSGAGKVASMVKWAAGASAGKFKTARNCLIHGNGAHAASPFRAVGIGNADNANCSFSCAFIAHNNVVANIKSGSTVNAVGIANTASAETCHVCNNAVDDIDVTGGVAGVARGITTQNSAIRVIKNNVVTKIGTNTTGGTKTCFNGNGASTVGANNASDDATAFGTGALTSITRGDNLNDPDNGDFRPLNDDSPIYEAGADLVTTPTGVNLDLKGRDRDAQGDTWSIGAYQLSAGGVVSNGITLVAPTAYTIRKRSSGTATYTVSGTYTGTPTAIEVRVNAGSWATLDAAPAAGAWTGTVSVPEGTNSLSVRFSNDTGVTASVSNILVGDVFLIAGQSNAAGRLTNVQTYTHASQKAAVFDFNDTAWRNLTDPTNETASGGTPWPLFATQFLADRGVPVGIINAAEGGLTIDQWWTTSAQAKYTAAKARVTASGVNGLSAVLFDLGESDAINDTTEADFNSRLDGLAGDVASTYSCSLLVAQTGTTTGIDADGDLDAIRSAQVTAWGDNANVKPGPLGYDRAGLHWETDAEGLTIAARWWLAIQSALYSGSNGRGPRLSSATLNADRNAITVVFDRALKTGLTFGTAAWTVLDNGTPTTVSSVAYHGSNTSAVVLTLSAALSGADDTCTLYLASGNDAAGVVVPKSDDINMPSGSAVQIPAEPFWGEEVAEAPASGGLTGILRTLTGAG
jgi:hypothetical protein